MYWIVLMLEIFLYFQTQYKFVCEAILKVFNGKHDFFCFWNRHWQTRNCLYVKISLSQKKTQKLKIYMDV